MQKSCPRGLRLPVLPAGARRPPAGPGAPRGRGTPAPCGAGRSWRNRSSRELVRQRTFLILWGCGDPIRKLRPSEHRAWNCRNLENQCAIRVNPAAPRPRPSRFHRVCGLPPPYASVAARQRHLSVPSDSPSVGLASPRGCLLARAPWAGARSHTSVPG